MFFVKVLKWFVWTLYLWYVWLYVHIAIICDIVWLLYKKQHFSYFRYGFIYETYITSEMAKFKSYSLSVCLFCFFLVAYVLLTLILHYV